MLVLSSSSSRCAHSPSRSRDSKLYSNDAHDSSATTFFSNGTLGVRLSSHHNSQSSKREIVLVWENVAEAGANSV